MATLDTKTKTVLVWGSELQVEFARRLSHFFKKVYFFSNWKCSFPSSDSTMPGDGLEEIERVKFPFQLIDEIDLWVFVDLLDQDVQVHLRALGKRVWGPGIGENLELNRESTCHLLMDLDMPVMRASVIYGIDALELVMHEQENLIIKVSMWRGDFETFKHKTWDLSEQWLNRQRHRLGIKAKVMEFFVQEMVPEIAAEIGGDMWSIDGQFPATAAQGYEIKDCGLVLSVKPYNELAKPVRWVNEKLAPGMKKMGYRGFWSTEILVAPDKTPYFIDATCRLPTPPNELYQEMVDNWGDILWFGAEGQNIPPVWKARYGFEALIYSGIDNSGHEWQSVSFPDEYRNNIKLFNLCQVEGRNCIVPLEYDMSQIGAIIAYADKLEDAVDQVKEIAETIGGEKLEVKIASADEALQAVEDGESVGIDF